MSVLIPLTILPALVIVGWLAWSIGWHDGHETCEKAHQPPHRKTVLVSGVFDMMHPGHVAFLKKAATYGHLHVCVGSDKNVELLKGEKPRFNEKERCYMVAAIGCVKQATISSGMGVLDFEDDIDWINPVVFVVNQDGDSKAKRKLCERRGIRYYVRHRTPAEGMREFSTTDLKEET